MLAVVFGHRSVTTVQIAGIAYKDCFLLDTVATLTMSGTRIDSMFVVEASTNRVTFDNLITHRGYENGR